MAALLLLQAPLWLNPGYFAHDELQWAARADTSTPGQLPWASFFDVAWFQFRPLTFNLWLLLSHFLFESPRLFHAVCVLAGSFNALLLADVLRRAGCRAQVASGAALVFALGPFAAWVHGWVGCLGDLLWVGFGLGTVAVLQRQAASPERSASVIFAALAAVLTTLLALLSKEAALAIPALLALGTLLLRFPRHWLAATLASGIVAMLYLALRLDTLIAPGEAASYRLHPAALPARWFEYMVYPWALGTEEIHVLRMASWSKWLLLAFAPLALIACLWRASWRLALAWLLGATLVLAPVLALPVSFNQYGYGFAALGCGMAALAWQRLGRTGRGTLVVLALVAVAHGFQIQGQMLETGRLQAVFSPSLAEQAQAQRHGVIALWPERASQFPIYARLVHDVPAWRGIPLGARVGMAANAEQATHLIAPDGHVQPRGATP